MTDQEWQQFFDLLQKIMQLPVTWQEKRTTVYSEAVGYGAETYLEEFTNWFAD